MQQIESVPFSDIRAADDARGGHFFERGAMRFFGSRAPKSGYRGLDGRVYFVTSEQFDEFSPRLYTVRAQKPDGSIDTIGKFQGYETARSASAAARRLSRAQEAVGK